jgi:hypothetical protein
MALVIRPEMGNIASVDRGNRRRNKDVGRAKLSSMSGGSSRHARRMSISGARQHRRDCIDVLANCCFAVALGNPNFAAQRLNTKFGRLEEKWPENDCRRPL